VPGRVSFDYTIRTTTDAVAPVNFVEHSRVVRDLWRHTEIEITVPPGASIPRRRWSDGALLPNEPVAARRRAAEDANAEAAPNGGLPSAPAPILGPPQKGAAESRESGAFVEERDRSARPSNLNAQGNRREGHVPEVPAEPVPRRRRRPQKSRSAGPDRTWIFLILVVGLVVVAIVVAMSMNKK